MTRRNNYTDENSGNPVQFMKKEVFTTDKIIPLLLFLLGFLIYYLGPARPLTDPLWAVHVSGTIIWDGDLEMSEFREIAAAAEYYGLHLDFAEQGDMLPFFPVGVSILSAPFVWILGQVHYLREGEHFYTYLMQTSPRDAQLVAIQTGIAALFAAATGAWFYLVARLDQRKAVALLGALLLMFGTPLFSTGSRVLWQHGPSALMLTAALYFFLKAREDERYVRYAAPFLALSFVIRPTNAISVLFFSVLVLRQYRRQLLPYLLWAAVIALPFFWMNWTQYHALLQPYFFPSRVSEATDFWRALQGNLISPNRGIFIWIPFMILLPAGIWIKVRKQQWKGLDTVLVIVAVLHLVVISRFPVWWAGQSYGNRFVTELMPFFVYLLLPLLAYLTERRERRQLQVRIGLVVLTTLVAFSVIIHYRGAYHPWMWLWYDYPFDTYSDNRIWDWQDIMFLRTREQYPVAANSELAVSNEAGLNTAETPTYLHFHNYSREPYSVAVRYPPIFPMLDIPAVDYGIDGQGIPIYALKKPLAPGESVALPFAVAIVDEAGLGNESLGALQITVENEAGDKRVQQIVPVSIYTPDVRGPDTERVGGFLLPADVQVNGGAAGENLLAMFGSGFYQRETLDTAVWRWAQSPAQLYIYTFQAQSVILELKFANFFPPTPDGGPLQERMVLQTADGEISQLVTPGAVWQVPLQLAKDWNAVTLISPAGNTRPVDVGVSGEERPLSFALESVNLLPGE
jgi:hypothetical protein